MTETVNNLCYVCSPYRGDIKRNKQYARELTRTAIENGFYPVTVHLYLTEVTDDNNPAERELGMNTGIGILDSCKYILIGGRYGISEGMAGEIRRALDTGKVLLTPGGENGDEIKANVNVAELDRYVRKHPKGQMADQGGGEWADMPTLYPAT